MNKREILAWGGRCTRRMVLLGGLAGIVGLGCATINMAPPKDERAVRQFLPNAERGDPVAQYQLALSYRYGTSGLPKDMGKAMSWMRAAAAAGNADARFALGDILLNGSDGVPADPGKALEWFRLAAADNLGNRLWLADLLENGRPGAVPADPAAARQLYLAAAARSRLARQRLGRLAERGVEPGGGQQALTWYLLAGATADVERLEGELKRPAIERARADAARWQP